MADIQLARAKGAPTALAPVELRNAGEHVADRLVTAIALGEYITGQRLPSERELAALLAVNRASIREALHALAAAGYVEIRRGRHGGAFVQAAWGPESQARVQRTLAPDWEDFEALLDARRLIEPVIAAAAADRHDEPHLETIRAASRAYHDAEDDREGSRAADQALHLAIVTATRNRYLVDLSQQIRARVSLGFQAEPYSLAIRERAKVQHAELVDAIAERRASDAAAIAHAHFSLTETALRDLMKRVNG
jgi:GntR family transcriptional repressor for pyruvate dehydrogenase complex